MLMMQTSSEKVKESSSARSGTFPVKLHNMLDHAEAHGPQGIIAWRPGGRAFSVQNKDRLVDELLPLYFRQKRFTSFQRQLEIYGFRRLTTGPDKGLFLGYTFLRPCCSVTAANFCVLLFC